MYLNGVISELEARRNGSVSGACGRRPYLNVSERKKLECLSQSELKRRFRPGEVLHAPFSDAETRTVDSVIKFKAGVPLSDAESKQLTGLLGGRMEEDVSAYLHDRANECLGTELWIFTDDGTSSEPLKLRSSPSQDPVCQWAARLRPQLSLVDSSGSITSIAVRSPHKGSSRVMIGACTTLDAAYNRSGELLFVKGDREREEPAFSAEVLNGHFLQGIDRRSREFVRTRQTVAAVLYDPLVDVFLTGGFDGKAKVWDAQSGAELGVAARSSQKINSIACHATSVLSAFGTGSGHVLCNRLYGAESIGRAEELFSLSRARSVEYENTIDFVVFPTTGQYVNVLAAGIGKLCSSKSGAVECWDVDRETRIGLVDNFDCSLTWLSSSPCGKFLLTGTGSVTEDMGGGDGIVRLFEHGSELKSAAISVRTAMMDIDSLSLCPKSHVLFVGESSDCSIAAYDLRYISGSSTECSRPIFKASHGQSGADAVVPHVWLRGGDLLVSGGFDGRVCIWDCRAGFTLLRQLQFNASIACITAADDDLCIWVGTDNGGVYMVSSAGYLDGEHPMVISAAKGGFY